MAFAGTVALATGLVIGIAGYDRFSGGGSPSGPTAIPAASFLLPGTPRATGCDVPVREAGAIEQIMETPPSQSPYFPRLNAKAPTDPIVGTGSTDVDGTTLWMNSSPDDSRQTEIQTFLDTVFDCRAYAIDAQGHIDMEGPYFSLYSDDYFRRELNGFTQAGMPLEINTFWLPSTKPEIVDVRKLMDGDRYLVVLTETTGDGTQRVLSVVPGEDGAWYIDEVGSMTEPQIDAEGTPIIALPNVTAEGTPGATEPSFIDQFPHALTVSIGDLAVANANPWTCDEQNGTPIPCDGMGLTLLGPWAPNELPANVLFTYTFVNTSDVSTHIASPELGIDVDVPAGQQVDIDVDAEAGPYDIVFTQGAETSTRTWLFEPAGGHFTMG